jgi:sulfite exporter TauE/SafE
MLELIASSFTVGFLASLHCAGMCGPLAVAVGCAGCPGRSGAGRIAPFLSGKLAAYALLGLAAGAVGAAFGTWKMGPFSLAVLALAAGIAMVILGGLALWRRAVPRREARPGPVATLLSAAVRSRSPAAPLAAGALAALMPCGLVWAMVARALAAGSPLASMATMAAFGLGTSPALAAVGWVGGFAGVRLRRWGEVAAATAVVVIGLVGIWRGVAGLGPPAAGHPCHGM